MQGNVKNIKVSTIMTRVNDRSAMRKRIEEETMQHIAKYIAKRPGTTIESLFDRYETDGDGCIDIDELTVMFKELDINVNNQLLRILLAIFDKNEDQRINREEFCKLLEQYVKKKPITTEDLKSNVFTDKEKEELKDMYNEEVRDKAVWEDFDFDHDDLKVVQKREQSALALIRAGEMPSETINGEIQVLLFDSTNFLEVP